MCNSRAVGDLGGRSSGMARDVGARGLRTSIESGTAIDGSGDFAGTPRFEIERVLGAGGMGVVYQARDRERNARIALKTLRVADGFGIERFKKEFRALANITHPNLAQLGELYHEQGQWFFTMELLEGETFVEHVRGKDGHFHEARLRAALAQLVAGLSALHAARLVHRDVKPSNILVTPAGRLVLLDFGLVAQTHHNELTRSTPLAAVGADIVGTVIYMAPEQARGEPVGPAADWYSVGVVLYEALTGELPFAGTAGDILQQKQHRDGPAPGGRLAAICPELDQLCADLLRREPAKRPTGAEITCRLKLTLERLDRDPPPAFVGRQDELATLRRAFRDSSVEARLVTVCVQGASGLGKSALVRTLLNELKGPTTSNAVILESRCYERESLPYKAFDGAVEALSRHLSRLEYAFASVFMPKDTAALACLFPALRRVPMMAGLGAPEIPDPQELRARAFAALRELLSRLCARQPVVLSIDDFQWADADSLALLDDLVRAPEPPPLLVVITLRDGAGVASRLAALPGDVRQLPLAPLQAEDAEALARMLLASSPTTGPVPTAELARTLAEEAEGHPLFLRELVRHVSEFDGEHARGTVRLEEAVWARVDRLPEQAGGLLALLSVAGAPVREGAAMRASDLDGEAFALVTRLLRNAQLVRGSGPARSDTLEPYHDRIREAVLARLSPEERRHHHRRLADALEEDSVDDPESLVRHLLAAGESSRAAAHAERAAAHARTVLAFDRAAELYRVAVRLESEAPSGPPEKLRGLRRALAHALVCLGRGAEAATEFQAAAAGAPPVEALDLQRLGCEQLLVSGRIDEGLAAAGTVLSQLGLNLPGTPRAAMWSLIRARARLRLRGLRYHRREESEVPPLDLVRIDSCWSASMGLAVVDFIRAADFATRHLLLALEAGEPYRISRALCNEACFSASGGGRTQKRTAGLLMRALEAAELVRTPRAQALASFAAGSIAMMEGRWQKARHHLLAADATYRERCADLTGEVDAVDMDILVSLAYLGELADLSQRLRVYLRSAEERGDLYAATLLRTSEANLAWLAADDPAGARREAQAAVAGYSQKAIILQAYLDPLAQARIDLYEGDAARAWQRVRDNGPAFKKTFLDKVQLLRIAMTYVRGTAALAASAAEKSLLGQAASDARRLQKEAVPWARGLASLLEAGLCAARGDQSGALSGYTRAALQLDEVDMALHAACARWRQGEILGGESGRDLVAGALAFMRGQAIRNPARMRAVYTAG